MPFKELNVKDVLVEKRKNRQFDADYHAVEKEYVAKFIQHESGYHVEVPDLPGCFSQGETLEEAYEMIEDAIAMWICDAEDSCDEVPTPRRMEMFELDTSGAEYSYVLVDTLKYRMESE